jgi:hypothetical protein
LDCDDAAAQVRDGRNESRNCFGLARLWR